MSDDLRIVAHRNGEEVDVTEAVQVVYDALHGSMDCGSGFLDGDEEEAMRGLARAAGFEMPLFPSDQCVRCEHTHDRHASNGCQVRIQVEPPVYKRKMLTHEVSLPIAQIQAADNIDELNKILATSHELAYMASVEYEGTVLVKDGVYEKCSCRGWRGSSE